MYFVLQTPSLQHLAGVKIVTCLWSERDVFTQIAQTCNGLWYCQLNDSEEWTEIVEQVKGKVSALPLPEICKKKLLNFVKPIGMELGYWGHYYNLESYNFHALDNLLPNQLCWSMHGTVDHKKTAELLVKDERVDVVNRYEIACINCLEDEARELIRSIGEERRREYMNGMKNTRTEHHGDLITYFTCTLSGDVDQLHRHFERLLSPSESITKYLFEAALRCGTRATCKYLFNKLNQRGKEQVLFDDGKYIVKLTLAHTTNALYYLSLINEEQQERVLGNYFNYLLYILLGWPMQSLIMEAIKRRWPVVGEFDCVCSLVDIADKIRPGFLDYDYPQLFWECWRLSSAHNRGCFLNDWEVLDGLIETKEEKFIKLVLNEAPSHQLKQLVEHKYNEISGVLTDESVISEAALMECKEKAALNSSKDANNVEKRLRSEQVGRLVDLVMESRTKRREKK